MPDNFSLMTKLAIGLGMVILLPRLLERVRLPGVLGYILAGVVLGPGVTGVLKSDSESLTLWAELGKLLFMFFVGFEIDLEHFGQVRARAALFGFFTFAFPFALAYGLGSAFGYSWVSSLLIGSIIASHTLLAHPILLRLGLLQREAILVAVGGTIFTDVASMLVLALAVSIHQTGFSRIFLLTELLELAVYVVAVLFGLSKLARKLIIWFGDSAEARVCILLMVIAIAAQLAEMIKLEGIVGAFLVGIAVKRALRGKFAVEQLEVLAKALFIPSFFLATGFLIDLPLLGKTVVSKPGLVVGLIAALLIGKYLAAHVTRWRFHYSRNESLLIFSLTIPQMAATLASAVVGYQTRNAQGVRMLDGGFVNAVLVLVVVSCVIGPVLTERWGRHEAASPSSTTEDEKPPPPKK